MLKIDLAGQLNIVSPNNETQLNLNIRILHCGLVSYFFPLNKVKRLIIFENCAFVFSSNFMILVNGWI